MVPNAGRQGDNTDWRDVPEGRQVRDVYYNNGPVCSARPHINRYRVAGFDFPAKPGNSSYS